MLHRKEKEKRKKHKGHFKPKTNGALWMGIRSFSRKIITLSTLLIKKNEII